MIFCMITIDNQESFWSSADTRMACLSASKNKKEGAFLFCILKNRVLFILRIQQKILN